MNDTNWLYTFIKDNYGIIITPELAEEDFFSTIINFSVPELAYLLICLGKYYNISVAAIMEKMSGRITYNALMHVVEMLREKDND